MNGYNNSFVGTTPSVNVNVNASAMASSLQNVPANIRQILNSVSNLPPVPVPTMLPMPPPIQTNVNISNMMPIMVPAPNTMSSPMANMSQTATPTAMSTPNSPAVSALGQTNQSLSEQLTMERTKSKTVERAYWSLRSEYDTVVKAKDKEIARLKRQNADMLRMAKQLRATHHENVELLKAKSKEANRKNNSLEQEVKRLRKKEKEVKRQEVRQRSDGKSSSKVSSQSVVTLMEGIRKYGAQLEALQKSQTDLAPSLAKSKRMTDMVTGYKSMVEQLDVLKVQCQGDELERMTRDREYIALLEKEKDGYSSRLSEYNRRNQKLQMKLRQTQNMLNRANQHQRPQRVFDRSHAK